jgi:hypothetical protein
VRVFGQRGRGRGEHEIIGKASHRCQTALRVTGRSAPLKGDGNLRLARRAPRDETTSSQTEASGL